MNRAISFVVLICALLPYGSALANGREFACSPAFGEMGKEYPKLICAGNDWMERGNPKKALEIYRRASKLGFFESPNFLVYFRIAWAEAATGDKESARLTLNDFENMLSIFTGERVCQDKSSSVSARAIDIMCQPIYGEDSYTSRPGAALRRAIASEYLERIKTLVSRYKIGL